MCGNERIGGCGALGTGTEADFALPEKIKVSALHGGFLLNNTNVVILSRRFPLNLRNCSSYARAAVIAWVCTAQLSNSTVQANFTAFAAVTEEAGEQHVFICGENQHGQLGIGSIDDKPILSFTKSPDLPFKVTRSPFPVIAFAFWLICSLSTTRLKKFHVVGDTLWCCHTAVTCFPVVITPAVNLALVPRAPYCHRSRE